MSCDREIVTPRESLPLILHVKWPPTHPVNQNLEKEIVIPGTPNMTVMMSRSDIRLFLWSLNH